MAGVGSVWTDAKEVALWTAKVWAVASANVWQGLVTLSGDRPTFQRWHGSDVGGVSSKLHPSGRPGLRTTAHTDRGIEEPERSPASGSCPEAGVGTNNHVGGVRGSRTGP